MDDSEAQQAWWDSMTDEQREAYKDRQARRRAERAEREGAEAGSFYGEWLDKRPW